MQSQIEDNFLISASLAGDEAAFGKLYDKYVNSIYRFIAFRVRSQDEAHDLTAETFLKSWQYLVKSERTVDNFRALLYRIAGNLVVDHYREQAHERLSLSAVVWENIIDKSFNLEADLTKRDDVKQIYRAMDRLTGEQKDLLLMKYADDLGVKEMAQITGKSPGTVRVALHRAIKALKTILKNI